MAPRKTRARRDSFGLELREDGTITFDLPRENLEMSIAKPVKSNVRHGGNAGRTTSVTGSSNSSSGHRPRPQEPERQQAMVSPPKTRRRRDSSGLEVREDGTLSLDQLPDSSEVSRVTVARPVVRGVRHNGGVGTSDGASPRMGIGYGPHQSDSGRITISPNSAGRSRSSAIGGRRESTARAGGTSRIHRNKNNGINHGRSINTGGNHVQRRDDGGGDGQGQGGHQSLRVSVCQQSTTTEDSHICSQSQNHTGPSVTSEFMVSETRGRSGVRAEQTQTRPTDDSELEILRERVRRLEAALVERAQPPNTGSLDAPPAYESRPSSPIP